jgi:hypothetical protein
MINVLTTSAVCLNSEFTVTESCQGMLNAFVQTSTITAARPLEN